MLAPYRRVLSVRGARWFSLAAFMTRLPISMVTLGIVLLVVDRSGSYGQAGAVSAAYMVATGAASPALARLIDKLGQHVVVVPGVIGFAVGLGGLVVAVDNSAPTPVPHLLAALGGVCYPPVGACVRARWSHTVDDPALLHTAFSLEAVVDETIFIVGPVIITVLATQVSEVVGMMTVIAFALLGGFWFGALRSTEPPATVRHADERRAAMDWLWLTAMVTAAACLGSLFGATEVVTVAFSREHGHPQAVGALLAVWASGSLIAGVITGMVSFQATPLTRYRWGALSMAAAMLPLPFIQNLPVLAIVLFLAGFAISPTLVATMSLIESRVPASRLTEGITWVTTGIGLGVAPGAAIAGQLIDSHGASRAYVVPAVSGVLAAVIAWSTGGPRTPDRPLSSREVPTQHSRGVE